MANRDFKFFVDDTNLWWAWRVWKGQWESSVHNYLTDVLHPGDIFFDIGAYMGEYAILAATLVQPGGAVYAFEPDPVARDLLERNLATNNVPNVTVVPYALTDHEGVAWLDNPTWLTLGSSDSMVTSSRGSVEIQTVSLREFCERNQVHPSVIKIDTPGSEPKVIAGGIDVLKSARVSVLELNERKLRQLGQDPSQFLQSLFDLGKRIIVLHQRSPEGPAAGTELTRGATVSYMNLALIGESPDRSAAASRNAGAVEEKRVQPVDTGPSPLRIGFYAPQAHYLEPGYSGDHVFSRSLVAGLEQRGHEVRILSRLDPTDFASGRISTRRLMAELRSVRREVKQYPPDAWLIYSPSDDRPDLFGWWQRPERYVLFAAHAPTRLRRLPGNWRGALLAFAHRHSLNRANSITAFRHLSADRLRAFGVADQRLHLLPPAAVTWEWLPSREQARQRLGLPEHAPVILCVGRFSERKRDGEPRKTEMMLDLIAAVATLPSEVVLVLVGDGSGRARLEEAAGRFKRQVRFSGFVEHDDLKWYYAACTLFAFPHPKDDSWVTVMEAQYCGRPVVTMRTRSAEITVQDGRTGLLARDLDEFREQIAALAGDRARCESMGHAARQYIREFHSIETRVRQIEDLLFAAGTAPGSAPCSSV